MPVTTTRALFVLLVRAACLGSCTAAAYDVLRILRDLFCIAPLAGCRRLPKLPLPPAAGRRSDVRLPLAGLLLHATDFLYCTAVGAAGAIFLSAFADGMLRWTTAVGAALGFFLYRITVSRAVLFIVCRLLGLVRFLLLWMLWAVGIPVARISAAVGRLVGCAAACLGRLCLPVRTEMILQRELREIRRICSRKRRRMDASFGKPRNFPDF